MRADNGSIEPTYTKDAFVLLLEESKRMISAAIAEGKDPAQVADLFGIYYRAFAGVVRSSGAMYRKEMDTDGYARIVMSVNGSDYVCRDTALRDALGDAYADVVRPYEDTSASYVRPYAPGGAMQARPAKVAQAAPAERAPKPPAKGRKKPPAAPDPAIYRSQLPALMAELAGISPAVRSRAIGAAAAALAMALALIFL